MSTVQEIQSLHGHEGVWSVRDLIDNGSLRVFFQPIVDLTTSQPFAHEALARPPLASPWLGPLEMLSSARSENLSFEFEFECLHQALLHWSRGQCSGRLFINVSAAALVMAAERQVIAPWFDQARALGLSLASLVLEITEHDAVHDIQPLLGVAERLRREGGALALDDFGDGRSSLRLWSELRPEYVKIDKYFIHEVNQHSHKFQTVQALQHLADTFQSQLIAEGVESGAELQVIRDLGIPYVQGFFLGEPLPEVASAPLAQASEILQSRQIAVLPQPKQISNRGLTARSLLIDAPTLKKLATHDDVAETFKRHKGLHALALLDGDRPEALISRKALQDLYLQVFFRDMHGKHPALPHANTDPLLVDIHTPLESLTEILTSSDQRYLNEGFIITEGGLYRGLGTGGDLVRMVTEARIEAARHANPLTFLPGNIPITLHIQRLLENDHSFVACYADLNQFKAFNDYYGYWRGDAVIRLEADCFKAACEPQRDFIGHVGGDDFVLLMQSEDWHERLEAAVKSFNQKALELYDASDQIAGGIRTEDRNGQLRFHPCTTVSVGAVRIAAGQYCKAEDVANAAASAKHHAKQARAAVFVLDAPTTAKLG